VFEEGNARTKIPACTVNETRSIDEEKEKLKGGGLGDPLYRQKFSAAMAAYVH
jgi:hypothetical protein